jgi:hypothetical protein
MEPSWPGKAGQYFRVLFPGGENYQQSCCFHLPQAPRGGWLRQAHRGPARSPARLRRHLPAIIPNGRWLPPEPDTARRTPEETFVVYSGRILRYPRRDSSGRAEAAAYGRSLGVPENQLDWPV